MDANEFLRKVAPASKQSCVAPYWDDVIKLRDSNCTLGQVCDFLKENRVQISIAGLSKYIKRREEKEKGGTQETTARTKSPNTTQPEVPPSTRKNGWTNEELFGLTLKQKGERVAGNFVKDAPNPLLKRIKD